MSLGTRVSVLTTNTDNKALKYENKLSDSDNDADLNQLFTLFDY